METAEDFLRKGKIKLALILCRLNRRVTLTKCYKCQQFEKKIPEGDKGAEQEPVIITERWVK